MSLRISTLVVFSATIGVAACKEQAPPSVQTLASGETPRQSCVRALQNGEAFSGYGASEFVSERESALRDIRTACLVLPQATGACRAELEKPLPGTLADAARALQPALKACAYLK